MFPREVKVANQSRKKRLLVFCSGICSATWHTQYTITVSCGNCGKEVRRNPSAIRKSRRSKESSGISFCSRSCSSIFRNRLRTGVKHPNFKHGLSSAKRNRQDQCVDCGESRCYLLASHHIDGNRRNNDSGNRETVCGNCHLKRHLRLKNGRLVVDYKVLTDRSLLASL